MWAAIVKHSSPYEYDILHSSTVFICLPVKVADKLDLDVTSRISVRLLEVLEYLGPPPLVNVSTMESKIC